jgi:HD-GYP domain-containing protein (c-di-GMP phosphodiesterase class II)
MTTTMVDTSAPTESMCPIPLATLLPGEVLDFDLYLAHAGSTPVLYRSRECPLETSDLSSLIASGVECLYTTRDCRTRYEEYLAQHVEQIVHNENLPPEVRFRIVQQCARRQVRQALQLVDTSRAIQLCGGLATQLSHLVVTGEVLPASMWNLLAHDSSTFTHSMNVASYAALLARLLGVTDRGELARIAVGGLLHDYGKRNLSAVILRKRGPLTPEEWLLVRQHPQAGFEALCDREELDWGQLMMIYQHHEGINGRGYPVGIAGSEIHWQGKLCAVVDTFDALTCHRTYRRALSVDEALAAMQPAAAERLDKEMFQCWTENLTKKAS